VPTKIFRYEFSAAVDFEDIEDTLVLSLLATEALHGDTGVRLETRYYVDRPQRRCTVDATTDPGHDFNRIFAGLMIREFGNDAFRVERLSAHETVNEAA
jgi:hypothetical protein